MSELSQRNFGLLVAYVLPGFVGLWGVSPFSKTVQSWITISPESRGAAAALVYVTLASLAVGMTVSALRWLLIDHFHHVTGVRPPQCDFQNLDEQAGGFMILVESHYRYYQFYANVFVAVALAYVGCLIAGGGMCRTGWNNVFVIILELVLLAGSRDALKKYYSRVERLLGSLSPHDRSIYHDKRYRKEAPAPKRVLGEEASLNGKKPRAAKRDAG